VEEREEILSEEAQLFRVVNTVPLACYIKNA
jgi:hypothetical protein